MDEIAVEVCYATPDRVFLKAVQVPAGAMVRAAIEASGVLIDVPEIDIDTSRVGVHGKLRTLDCPLRRCDRIEIYRPLVADPKEARRKRALKSR